MKLKPGLEAFYAIQPVNELGLSVFYNSWGPYLYYNNKN